MFDISDDEELELLEHAAAIIHTHIGSKLVQNTPVYHPNEGYAEKVLPNTSSMEFWSHFRMTKSTFNKFIQEFIQPRLPIWPGGREAIDAEEVCLISVWYLANQTYIREISAIFGLYLEGYVIHFKCSDT